MKYLDRFLNGITMYRLTLGGLQLLALLSLLFSIVGILPYTAISLLLSFFLLAVSCYTSNALFVKIFRAAPSVESSSITAFILFFLVSPVSSVHDALVVLSVGAVAMASKYLLAIRHRHLFNPAAFGAFFAGVVFHAGALWWVATLPLLPFVLMFGLLVVRKIRRGALFVSGVFSAVLTLVIVNITQGSLLFSFSEITSFLQLVCISWPVLFFSSIMLTEPATSPPTRKTQIVYATLAGILFGLPVHIGNVYMSPELALLLANVYAYLVGAKDRLQLTLLSCVQTAKDTFHFSFASPRRLAFTAGQYLEWTLPHAKPDNRGTRRYFTIASSPQEETVGLGVKIGEASSTFKQALRRLQPGDHISVSQRSGDFVLPASTKEKLVFIAGGIGITPFRSMIAFMQDAQRHHNTVLLYAAGHPEDFAYQDFFAEAEASLPFKALYIPTEAPATWDGHTGKITEALLRKEIPDFSERIFYISGPGGMVDAYVKLLRALGIPQKKIRTDYFPGL